MKDFITKMGKSKTDQMKEYLAWKANLMADQNNREMIVLRKTMEYWNINLMTKEERLLLNKCFD